MQYKLQMEREGGDHSFWEVFTGPRMLYRTLLGIAIQALQQMTGANFFFYVLLPFLFLPSPPLHPTTLADIDQYGTTIFTSVGLSNPFVTQIILGAVNVVTTFPGLYMVEKYGRRKCLALGAAWMFMCYMVFASLGHFALVDAQGNNNRTIGLVMIVFACLFIAAFASTWGVRLFHPLSFLHPPSP